MEPFRFSLQEESCTVTVGGIIGSLRSAGCRSRLHLPRTDVQHVPCQLQGGGARSNMALVFEQHEVSCVLPAFQANPEQGIALGLRTLSNHETAFPLFSVTVDGYSDIAQRR